MIITQQTCVSVDIAGANPEKTYIPGRGHKIMKTSQYNAAAQDFEQTLAQLRQLIEGDLARLEKQMEAAGAPWTPGRIPEWKDQ